MVNDNIAITKGDDFEQQYIVGPNPDDTPVDLTGVAVTAVIRKSEISTQIIHALTVTMTDIPNGHFKLTLTNAETSLLKLGYFVYDVIFTFASGKIVTYLTGGCNVLLGQTVQEPPESGTVLAQNPVIYVGLPGIQGIPGMQGPAGSGVSSINDVPGLTDALNSKASLIHTHVVNDITDFDGTVLAGGTF